MGQLDWIQWRTDFPSQAMWNLGAGFLMSRNALMVRITPNKPAALLQKHYDLHPLLVCE